MTLFQLAFWRSIGWALARTALAGVVPFLPALVANQPGAWTLAGSTVAMLLIATTLTSLRGIPDPDSAPWWQILLSRGLRQAAQFAAAGTVGAVLLSDIDWAVLGQQTAASALSTVLLAALTILPSDTAPAEVAVVPPATTDDYQPKRLEEGI